MHGMGLADCRHALLSKQVRVDLEQLHAVVRLGVVCVLMPRMSQFCLGTPSSHWMTQKIRSCECLGQDVPAQHFATSSPRRQDYSWAMMVFSLTDLANFTSSCIVNFLQARGLFNSEPVMYVG